MVMICARCDQAFYTINNGYWLGKTWIDWPDPTLRHVATGRVACGVT